MAKKKTAVASSKTKELQELEAIQTLIQQLPQNRQADIAMYAEDIRDILSDGNSDGVLALTLVALELAAVNAEIEKNGATINEQAAG